MWEDVKNQVIEISSDKLKAKIEGLNLSEAVLMVELNGAEIGSWEEYISEVQRQFKFPSDWSATIKMQSKNPLV
ncbi:hypothetical protein D3C76_380450 [compost metagenome]